MSARRRLPVLGLAACVLGLALSPLPFIAVGALSHFAPLFGAVALPAVLAAGGFLLWRYLAAPADRTARARLLAAGEVLSWTVVAAFLLLVTRYNLMGTFERVGAACTAFLVASALSLPVVAARPGALERRLDALPRGGVLAVLLMTILAAALVVALYLRTPPPPPI